MRDFGPNITSICIEYGSVANNHAGALKFEAAISAERNIQPRAVHQISLHVAVPILLQSC